MDVDKRGQAGHVLVTDRVALRLESADGGVQVDHRPQNDAVQDETQDAQLVFQAPLPPMVRAAGGERRGRTAFRWCLCPARCSAGATIRHGIYYRCTARTLAPGAAALIDHPVTVNLREDVVLQPLNDWIGLLFVRENIDQTVVALAVSQGGVGGTSDVREEMKARLTKAEVWLRRLRAAIEAGVDPAAVVEGINEAQAERAAAKAALENTSVPDVLSDGEIYAMIDSLGDVGAALEQANPMSLSRLYQQLRLQLRYDPHDQAVIVTAQPRVGSARVRGGT